MTRRGQRAALWIALGSVLALPGVAQAKTKTVNMGIPPEYGARPSSSSASTSTTSSRTA